MPAHRCTRIAVVQHWLVALLIIVQLGLILSVDLGPEEWIRGVIDTHKSTGITVLGLVLLRILWRAGHPPPLPSHYPRWERLGAHAEDGVLHALILLLPLTGWLHDSAWERRGDAPDAPGRARHVTAHRPHRKH